MLVGQTSRRDTTIPLQNRFGKIVQAADTMTQQRPADSHVIGGPRNTCYSILVSDISPINS
jgi:hypothetical protein